MSQISHNCKWCWRSLSLMQPHAIKQTLTAQWALSKPKWDLTKTLLPPECMPSMPTTHLMRKPSSGALPSMGRAPLWLSYVRANRMCRVRHGVQSILHASLSSRCTPYITATHSLLNDTTQPLRSGIRSLIQAKRRPDARTPYQLQDEVIRNAPNDLVSTSLQMQAPCMLNMRQRLISFGVFQGLNVASLTLPNQDDPATTPSG